MYPYLSPSRSQANIKKLLLGHGPRVWQILQIGSEIRSPTEAWGGGTGGRGDGGGGGGLFENTERSSDI